MENVDRSRIITAASIMVDKPMVARQGKEGPEVLIRKMRERKITVLPVVDPDGILVGEVHLKELLQLRKERILNIDSIVRKEVHSILGDTVVEDILPLMTKTNSPILGGQRETGVRGNGTALVAHYRGDGKRQGRNQ